MKILYCYYYANLGGVTSVIKSRMHALQRSGWEVHAVFDHDFGGVADLLAHGIQTAEVVGSIKERFGRVRAAVAPDVVTLFDMPELVEPARSLGAKVVLEIHTPILRTLLRTEASQLSAADRIIVPSEWSKAWIALNVHGSYDRHRIQVVPNIIDRRVFRTRDVVSQRDRPLLLWVGKTANYKRWHDAVRAMGVINSIAPVELCFVTGGDCALAATEAFLHEISECGLVGPVSWIHNAPIEEMAELYAVAAASGGLLLSTSESESFCLVAHEAMSCGVPVVAARAGAIGDLFVDDLAPLTFEIGDIEAASRIAIDLLGNPQARQRAVSAGLRRQLDFDSAALEDSYLRAIKDVHREPVMAEENAG